MMPLPKEPSGKSRRSAWFKLLWRAVRGNRIIAGDNIVAEHKPDGTVLHAVSRRVAAGGGGGTVVRAAITGGVSALVDYFLCSVEGESGVGIKVAKPYLLRVSPFDGLTVNGVAYEYTSGQLRKATASFVGTGYFEWQQITPAWAAGEIIYVTKNPEGGTDVGGAGYIDINADGRCWAELYVEE